MIIINILGEKKQHGLYSILHMENCTRLISLETILTDHQSIPHDQKAKRTSLRLR